jgi:hypothetical protein
MVSAWRVEGLAKSLMVSGWREEGLAGSLMVSGWAAESLTGSLISLTWSTVNLCYGVDKRKSEWKDNEGVGVGESTDIRNRSAWLGKNT